MAEFSSEQQRDTDIARVDGIDVSGLPEGLIPTIAQTTTRRTFLRGGFRAGALALVSNRAFQIAAVVAGSLADAACRTVPGGNTDPAYADVDTPITLQEYEMGIDMLPTPAQRSMVLLEAKKDGQIQGWGHGVLAQDGNGQLMLYTSYHVIAEYKADLGNLEWAMRVGGNVGNVSLESVSFEDKPESGVQPGLDGFGVKQANLTLLNNTKLTSAIEQGIVLPAAISPTPNHAITTNEGLLVMYMADGNPAHSSPTVLIAPGAISVTGKYGTTIISGGMCNAMSGTAIFEGKADGDSYTAAFTPDGRLILVALAVGFAHQSTDVGLAAMEQCSNTNMNISAINLGK